MDRCPNCGSSVRAGAKFCTTCGFRLPVPAAPQVESPASARRSPFDTTSSDSVMSSWTDPRPASQPEPAAPVVVDEPEAAVEAPAAVAADVASEPPPAPPFSGWPAYGTGFGPRSAAWGVDSQADNAPLPEYQDVPPVAEAAKHTVEDAVAAWSEGRDLPSEPSEPEPPAEPLVEVEPPAAEAVDALIEQAPAAPETEAVNASVHDVAEDLVLQSAPAAEQWAWPPDEDEAASVIDAAAGSQAESASDPAVETVAEMGTELNAETAGAGEAVEVEAEEPEASLDDDVAPIPTPTDAASADPAVRAAELVTELQLLLPRLSAKAEGAEVDVAGIAATLNEALASAEAETEAFGSLRAAIATAQARPRDVDVMLDLVARADAMAGMFAAHDRYKAAVERAVKSLSGDAAESPEPRW